MTVDVAFHLTYRKGYQSKLLFVHSRGCRCNFRGLLHSDDRKSPWWASRVGTQHDRSRFDTVIISMNLNSYASLAIFFIIPDLFFCFWPQNYTYYTRVSCVWFLSPSVSLQSNWAWKPSKPGLSISFSLWRFSSLLALQWRKLRRLACLKNLVWIGSSVATCRLACSEISLLTNEKKLKSSPGNGRTYFNLADGATALAQLYPLYSDRTRCFNWWQRALLPKLIINS